MKLTIMLIMQGVILDLIDEEESIQTPQKSVKMSMDQMEGIQESKMDK